MMKGDMTMENTASIVLSLALIGLSLLLFVTHMS